MSVPSERWEWNSYRLSGGKGWPWSPAIDAHTRRNGSEIQPGGLVPVDCDAAAEADGFRELGALAADRGCQLDLSGTVVVRTPGHGEHAPGWHLWWAADPSRPVRPGPLPGHPLIEIKTRCTTPGSPGYVVESVPAAGLAVIPRWLTALARPLQDTVTPGGVSLGGRVPERLEGLVAFLLEAGLGDGRNTRLYWAACRCAGMIAAGELDRDVAERALFFAAEENGHVAKHGAAATRGTIRSGFRQAVVA